MMLLFLLTLPAVSLSKLTLPDFKFNTVEKEAISPMKDFRFVPHTSCSTGLLAGIDLLKIEATLYPRTEDQPEIISLTREGEDGIFYICRLSLETDCIKVVPPEYKPCYCLSVDTARGERLLVGFRHVVEPRYSNVSISAIWQRKRTFQLPVTYDINSTQVAYLQNKLASTYSLPCQFPVAEDDRVIYCCNKTAQPCVATIQYEDSKISQGKDCAVVQLPKSVSFFTEPFTFQHSICGHPVVPFTCRAVREKSENIHKVPYRPYSNKRMPFLIAIACILVIMIMSSPFVIRHFDKRQQLQQQQQPGSGSLL